MANLFTMSHLLSINCQVWSGGPTINNKDIVIAWEVSVLEVISQELGTKLDLSLGKTKFFTVVKTVFRGKFIALKKMLI